MDITYKAMRAASCAFLTSPLPEYWEDMDRLESWLEEHAWEPLENYEGSMILEIIEDHAITIQQLINEAGEVK